MVAFQLGPLSVLGSVFSVLLVFNLLFAKWMLDESIDRYKIFGSLIILLGAVFASIGAPKKVKTQFTPEDIELLTAMNWSYLAFVWFFLGIALFAMTRFKRAIVDAGALGMMESQSDLTIRAWSAMLSSCSNFGCNCNTPLFYLAVLIWVILSFGGALGFLSISSFFTMLTIIYVSFLRCHAHSIQKT